MPVSDTVKRNVTRVGGTGGGAVGGVGTPQKEAAAGIGGLALGGRRGLSPVEGGALGSTSAVNQT